MFLLQLAALQGTRGEQEREAESGRAAAVAELRAVREELHTAQKRIADETAAGTESAAALRDALSAVSRADAARDTLAAQVATLQDQVLPRLVGVTPEPGIELLQ